MNETTRRVFLDRVPWDDPKRSVRRPETCPRNRLFDNCRLCIRCIGIPGGNYTAYFCYALGAKQL